MSAIFADVSYLSSPIISVFVGSDGVGGMYIGGLLFVISPFPSIVILIEPDLSASIGSLGLITFPFSP